MSGAIIKLHARPGAGLALLTVRWFREPIGPQLWALCKARRHHTCAESGRPYSPGAMVYRPIGNAQNRSQRILAVCIDQKERE